MEGKGLPIDKNNNIAYINSMIESKFKFTPDEHASQVEKLVKAGKNQEEAESLVTAKETEVNARLEMHAEEKRGTGYVDATNSLSPEVLNARQEQREREVQAALAEVRRQIDGMAEPEITFDPQSPASTVDDIRHMKERQTLERAGLNPDLAGESQPDSEVA